MTNAFLLHKWQKHTRGGDKPMDLIIASLLKSYFCDPINFFYITMRIKEPNVPWLIWTMYLTISKVLENRLENTRIRKILLAPMKFCSAACFLTYFPTSIFQNFRNRKMCGRVKFHAYAYLWKIMKGLLSDRKQEFNIKTFDIKRGRTFYILHLLVSKLL